MPSAKRIRSSATAQQPREGPQAPITTLAELGLRRADDHRAPLDVQQALEHAAAGAHHAVGARPGQPQRPARRQARAAARGSVGTAWD